MVPMWKFPQNIPAQELHQSKEPREAGEPHVSRWNVRISHGIIMG